MPNAFNLLTLSTCRDIPSSTLQRRVATSSHGSFHGWLLFSHSLLTIYSVFRPPEHPAPAVFLPSSLLFLESEEVCNPHTSVFLSCGISLESYPASLPLSRLESVAWLFGLSVCNERSPPALFPLSRLRIPPLMEF